MTFALEFPMSSTATKPRTTVLSRGERHVEIKVTPGRVVATLFTGSPSFDAAIDTGLKTIVSTEKKARQWAHKNLDGR